MKLRAVEPEDVDFILECESDTDSARWSDYKAPFSRNQLMTYALTYDADPFAAGGLRLIIESEGKERIGILDLYDVSRNDLRAYVGICIHPDFRRKGAAKNALKLLDSFITDRMGLRQLAVKISIHNEPAIRLFESSGYKKIATLPSWHRIGTKYHDILLLNKSSFH